MTTLHFLLLALSPFVIFDSDYLLISCLLWKSKTLWNIFIILGRNVEHDQMTCHKKEWQLWPSNIFFFFFPTLFSMTMVKKKLGKLYFRKRTFWCSQRLKSACTSTQADQSLCSPYEEILHPQLSKMHPVKIQSRHGMGREADLNLHGASRCS